MSQAETHGFTGLKSAGHGAGVMKRAVSGVEPGPVQRG